MYSQKSAWWGFVLLLTTLGLGALLLSPTWTTPGALDPAFGDDGKVTTYFVESSRAWALAVQPDGGIVVAGDSGGDIAVARYASDGVLDVTFGDGGKITTDFGGRDDSGLAVALQPDGKIVVAGSGGSFPETHFALARYHSDGTLDADFGVGGKVVTHFSYGEKVLLSIDNEQAHALAFQPDGKIVVAGGNGRDVTLARYNADGTPDAAFGVEGQVITDFSTSDAHSHDSVQSLVLQPDGKLVVAGTCSAGMFVARYYSDGRLDATFGAGGKADSPFEEGVVDQAQALVLQPDGKIVIAGYIVKQSNRVNGPNKTSLALVRFNSDGALDITSGVLGKVVTRFDGRDSGGYALMLQSDGKVVVAGVSGGDFVLARYTRHGWLDRAFGAGGKVTTDFGGVDIGQAVARQPDGAILVAGRTCSDYGCGFALTRYHRSLP